MTAATEEDAYNVLDEYTRGEMRFKQYVYRYIFCVSKEVVAHTTPVRLAKRAQQRGVMKKQLHEMELSFRTLKNKIAHGAENGLVSISSLLVDFQSVPFPLSLCNADGQKHTSNKAQINQGMKKLLTEAQLERHRNERAPPGTYTY